MINPKINKALQQFADAAKDVVDAMMRGVRAVADLYLEVLRSADWQAIAAVQAAPPRVRRLALQGKNARIRKKNIARAKREYRKRGPKA